MIDSPSRDWQTMTPSGHNKPLDPDSHEVKDLMERVCDLPPEISV